jgi:hypothetical protein
MAEYSKVDAHFLDYSVVIIVGVFIFASASWVLLAHKWFIGPIRNVDDSSPENSLDGK